MMSKLDDIQNKHVEQYTCLFSESDTNTGPLRNHSKQTQLKENQKKANKNQFTQRGDNKANKNQFT